MKFAPTGHARGWIADCGAMAQGRRGDSVPYVVGNTRRGEGRNDKMKICPGK